MKNWRGKSCWLHPQESDPDVDQGPGGVITSLTLLGPLFVSNVAENVKYLESS